MRPIDVKRMENRRRHAPGPGLWWKVFEDDGRMAVIPRGDIMVTLLTIAPLYALLRLAPTGTHPQLVISVTLVLLSMGASYTLGPTAFVATGPAMVYGWSALAWLLLSGDTSFQPGMQATIDLVKSLAMVLVLSFFTPALGRAVGGTFALAFYVSALAWFCVRRYTTGYLPEGNVRAYLGYAYLAMGLFALVFTVVESVKEARRVREESGLSAYLRRVVKALAMLAAGVAPLAVAMALRGLGDAAVLAGVVVSCAAVAVAGRLVSPQGLGCSLFCLLLSCSVAILTQADASALPPSTLTDALRGWLDGPVAQAMADAARPVVDAFTHLLWPWAASLVGPAFGYSTKVVAALPAGLVDVVCLYPGIVLLASCMGVAVSVLELVRPDLKQAQLEAEARELERARASVAEPEPVEVPKGAVVDSVPEAVPAATAPEAMPEAPDFEAAPAAGPEGEPTFDPEAQTTQADDELT